VIASFNDALIGADEPAVGFLKPWIYHGGYRALNDTTNGSPARCNVAGFPAEVGWNAVNGMSFLKRHVLRFADNDFFAACRLRHIGDFDHHRACLIYMLMIPA
jgi:hypothetical protein